MAERNFAEDVKINKYKLEDECEKQAGLYFFWAEKLANAKSTLGAVEDELKLVYAKTDMRIRGSIGEAGGKMTETGIKSLTETDEAIVNLKKEVQEAQSLVNTLYAAVSAMEHRKSELDNLVTLLVKGFYAAPNGGKREGVIESTERDIRKKLNKKES